MRRRRGGNALALARFVEGGGHPPGVAVPLHEPIINAPGGHVMSIVRSIEVIAQSSKGFDDACHQAIKEASHTLRGIRSFWIKNAECIVEDDEITMFRVNGKITFMVEREESPGSKAKSEREAAGDKPRHR
jgi:flavin-binding protein dodecin